MVDILDSVKAMYDEIGTHFSRSRQKTYGNAKSANWPVTDLYLAKLKKGDSVLDIGCGNGKLISGLAPEIGYLGTDFSQTLLAEAKKLHPMHEFRYGNLVESDHWKDLCKYEAIFCVAVLHHIPNHDQQLYVLRQVKKHLTTNGFLYLTVWNLWQEKYLQYHIDDHVEVPYNKDWKRYCVAFNIQQMSDLCSEAGLNVEEMFYADKMGYKADILTGQNLVVVGR